MCVCWSFQTQEALFATLRITFFRYAWCTSPINDNYSPCFGFNEVLGLPIWIFRSQILKFCFFKRTWQFLKIKKARKHLAFFDFFFSRKNLALAKHCLNKRWPESLFQTPTSLLFKNFWIRVRIRIRIRLFFKFYESDSYSDSGNNHRSNRNLLMFLLKKWPHRLLLLPKLKSDSGSGFDFSQIFDSPTRSGPKEKRRILPESTPELLIRCHLWSELHIHCKSLLARVYDHAGCKEYWKDFSVALKMFNLVNKKQMYDSVTTRKQNAFKD